MKEISFVDQTLRDSQQSLWGFMMRTDHITPVAEMMDELGYRAIAAVAALTQVQRRWPSVETLIHGSVRNNCRLHNRNTEPALIGARSWSVSHRSKPTFLLTG